jgi:Rrf2 family transcriptional regulator, cysteine metabolism repressor
LKMRLSTRARYGLKAVVDLAQIWGEGPVSLPQLAQSQGVSEAYLEQLLRQLKKADIVTAERGANGGYLLTRAPELISVESVLEALEGSVAVTDCVDTGGNKCENACTCSARPLFLRLQEKITGVLTGTSILDLAQDNVEQRRRIENAKGLS